VKLPILFAVSMLAAMFAPAQDQPNIDRQVRELDARRFRAMTAADLTTLDGLLSADLVYTHASGWRQTKAEFLASLRSGELIYRSFASENINAKAHGNTIVATGRASGKVRNKGAELNVDLLYLEVYVKQDGQWQLAAWESTRTSLATPSPR